MGANMKLIEAGAEKIVTVHRYFLLFVNQTKLFFCCFIYFLFSDMIDWHVYLFCMDPLKTAKTWNEGVGWTVHNKTNCL
jgi:hypothetical protein